jgi:hypothetical protein
VCAYYFSDFDYFDFPSVYENVTAEEIRDFLRTTVTADRCGLSVINPLK